MTNNFNTTYLSPKIRIPSNITTDLLKNYGTTLYYNFQYINYPFFISQAFSRPRIQSQLVSFNAKTSTSASTIISAQTALADYFSLKTYWLFTVNLLPNSTYSNVCNVYKISYVSGSIEKASNCVVDQSSDITNCNFSCNQFGNYFCSCSSIYSRSPEVSSSFVLGIVKSYFSMLVFIVYVVVYIGKL